MRLTSILFLLVPLGVSGAFGQRILYNQDLDTKGKATDAAAKKLTSATVTDNELQNLAALEKEQISRILDAGLVTMRRDIQSLDTWGRIKARLDDIQKAIDAVTLPTDGSAADKLEEVQALSEQLKVNLAKLKGASQQKPFSLDAVINHLGDVKDLLDFAGTAAKIEEASQASASVQKVVDGLKEINNLIQSVEKIWSTKRDISVDPHTLAPSKEETELAVMAVEVQYLKELTLLRARKDIDTAEMISLMAQLRKDMNTAGVQDDASIQDDLHSVAISADKDAVKREKMKKRTALLYLAATATAQNSIAADIEGVRETLAWRRYRIRTEAIYNGTYETAIQAASTRLSAYYAAGLKPSQIAQLIHDIVAAVSLPKIAF